LSDIIQDWGCEKAEPDLVAIGLPAD